MNNKNIFHLCFIKMKSNKKISLFYILGFFLLLFLLTLLLLILFINNYGLFGKIKNEKINSCIYLQLNDINNEKFSLNDFETLTENKYKIYKNYYFNYYYEEKILGKRENIEYPKIILDNKEYYYLGNDVHDTKFIFYDLSKNEHIFDEEENEYCKKYSDYGSIILGVDTPNKGEVIISSNLLDELQISYDDALNKTISFKQKINLSYELFYNNMNITDDYKDEEYIFKDFKIVGIYNSFISKRGIDNFNLVNDFIFNQNSFYETLDLKISNNRIDFTRHPHELYQESNELKCVNLLSNNNYSNIIIQFDNLDETVKYINKINDYTKNKYNQKFDYQATNSLKVYLNYSPIINLGTIILVISEIILFVIIFSNIFINIYYSINKNYKYLKMLKAIGMTDTNIKKTYLFETLIYFILGTIINLIVITIMMLTFKSIFSHLSKNTIMESYSLNFIYYYLSFIIVFVLILLFIFIVSLIALKPLGKEKKLI